MIDKDSMYNTPPCWCIYMLGLTLDWVDEPRAGIQAMEQHQAAARPRCCTTLHGQLQAVHAAHAEKGSRSGMNVTFRTGECRAGRQVRGQEAAQAGFVNLKGHRKVGGMRASIYNAMPIEGVEKLCDFIKKFDKEN